MSKAVLMDEKTMLNRVPFEGALEAVKNMEVCAYESMGGYGARKAVGVVGQSIKNIPGAVEIDGLGYHSVQFDQLIPALIKAVQELSAKVDELQPKRRAKKEE